MMVNLSLSSIVCFREKTRPNITPGLSDRRLHIIAFEVPFSWPASATFTIDPH